MHAVDVPDDVLEHRADVLGADEHRLGVGERLGSPAHELGRPRIEYSSSEPCAFTAYGRPLARPTGGTEQHVIRKDDVGGPECAQRLRVRLDVRLELARL